MNDNLVAAKTAMMAFLGALFAFLGWRMVLLLVWVFLMCVDYLSGTLAARQNGSWKSKTAKEGVGHKIGTVFVVLAVAAADFVIMVICNSMPNDVLPFDWPVAIFPMVTIWYILTELGSIVENAIEMGANVPAWLPKLLNATANVVENVGKEVLDQDVLESLRETADEIE
jgi:toxin secretion/phage lysis holin